MEEEHASADKVPLGVDGTLVPEGVCQVDTPRAIHFVHPLPLVHLH